MQNRSVLTVLQLLPTFFNSLKSTKYLLKWRQCWSHCSASLRELNSETNWRWKKREVSFEPRCCLASACQPSQRLHSGFISLELSYTISLWLKRCFPRWDWALPGLGGAETVVTAEDHWRHGRAQQLPRVRPAPKTNFLPFLPLLKSQGDLIAPTWSGHSHRDTPADPSPALSPSCSLHNPSTAARAAAQRKQTEELVWAKNRALCK